MAINVPIVSQFVPDGVDKAISEFKKLETNSQKVGLALEKAFMPAVAVVGALAGAAVLSAKAAMDDEAAQASLERQLKITTDATDEQVDAVNKYLREAELAAAISEDELRPAFENLVRSTGDITEAQELLNLAMDISAGTGKDLQTVSEALQEAYAGEVGPLKELDRSLTDMIESGADADTIMGQLADTFGGAAAANAETASGQFQTLGLQFENIQEAVGRALIPVIEELLPIIENMATFIENNTGLFIGIAVAAGGFAAAIVAANIAMKVWNGLAIITKGVNLLLGTSFSMLWVATGVGIIIAIIAAVITLQMKFDIFGKAIDGVRTMFAWLWDKAKDVMNRIIDGINLLIDAWNKLPLLPDIPKIEAGFEKVEDATKSAATVAEQQVDSWQMHTDQLAENAIEAEIAAAMMNQALIPALDDTRVAVDSAAWELAGFYDQLDREDAFARFSDSLANVQEELKGLEPGSDEFEAAMREAYRSVQNLSDTLGYIPAELEKTLLYRIEIGDIEGAERLGALISASDTYRATANDELRFMVPGGGVGAGVVNNVTINMPAGSNGQDVIDSINRETRRTGQAQIPVGASVRR